MKLAFAAVAASLILSAQAADAADLDAVRAALTPLRQSSAERTARMRPEFLVARDGLRDWIETHLATFAQNDDPDAFAKKLNDEIIAKDLSCVEGKAPGYNRCASPGELDARGFLGRIDVANVRGFLIVQAEIGVPCGFDETAYVYEQTKAGWRRIVDSSQTPANGMYVAEQIQQVMFGRPDNMPRDGLLLGMTGASPVCAGEQNQALHYRVWSVKLQVGSSLVVDGREGDGVVRRRDPAVSMRFEKNDILAEMNVRSFDPTRRSRIAVRRFNFEKDQAQRVAPLALSPPDFVEEWLRSSWSDAMVRTEARARPALEKIHSDAAKNIERARFSGATQRCEKEAGVVQVGVRFANGERFFRMKMDDHGAYEMRAADSAPSPACTKADASLDLSRSLF